MLTDAELQQVIKAVIHHLNSATGANQPFRRLAITEAEVWILSNGITEITLKHDELKEKVDELKDKVDKLEKEKE